MTGNSSGESSRRPMTAKRMSKRRLVSGYKWNGFVVFGFCGFVVLWFCGFWVLWFFGFKVLWFYPPNHATGVGRRVLWLVV